MKYINLLPPELQVRTTSDQRRSKPSSKTLLGCLVIPALLFVLFFGGMKLVQYRYKQKIEVKIGQDVPSPATEQARVLSVVSPKAVVQQQSPPRKKPPLIPEKKTSPVIVAPEAHLSISDKVKKKADGYTLCLGSFTTPDEAKTLMGKMKKQKLEPYQQVKQITKKVNTVYVDQSSTMEEAMGMSRQLEADGFEAFIKIRPQGAYEIGVKSFPSWTKAQQLAEQLKGLGYPAKIVPEQIPVTVYQVNLGHYEKYRQVKLIQNQLEEQGYHLTSIIKE